ncbi:MAG TPA: flagellar motor protein PomA [Rheinheimera sp.]|uniref:flagellar motor protein PomA n=1 Tax=Rheinheimera sp. TaxID=1869214 RepID=UPI000EE313DF|nr:flagellar motor protein PomA [Rheinheimera sp.]HCU65400.1 flagellar motor protein PomA [Rheinheimera sp.]
MDLATVIGLVATIGMMVWAMYLAAAGNLVMFYDFVSIVIVFGGTITVVIMKFTFGQLGGSFKAAGKAFMFKSEAPEELIEKAVQLADSARKGGFLALEEAEIPNPFMQKGINMLVDGHDADVVRGTLEKDIDLTYNRHGLYISIFKNMGDLGPAMGMIGTLVGLVAMLANMSDPKAIGPAMAVALLTTLYGAILANCLCIPLADKMAIRNEEEKINNQLILDAIMGIQDGQNPKVIEGVLRNYLMAAKREAKAEAE